jgi:hypothetical protein
VVEAPVGQDAVVVRAVAGGLLYVTTVAGSAGGGIQQPTPC